MSICSFKENFTPLTVELNTGIVKFCTAFFIHFVLKIVKLLFVVLPKVNEIIVQFLHLYSVHFGKFFCGIIHEIDSVRKTCVLVNELGDLASELSAFILPD